MNRMARVVGLVVAGLLLSGPWADAEPVSGRAGVGAAAGSVLPATCVVVVSPVGPAGPSVTVVCPPQGT